MSQTLEQVIQNAGDLVNFVRNQQVGPNVYPGVPSEFSNWRNEQSLDAYLKAENIVAIAARLRSWTTARL
mgnify:CR=1 FL=1